MLSWCVIVYTLYFRCIYFFSSRLLKKKLRILFLFQVFFLTLDQFHCSCLLMTVLYLVDWKNKKGFRMFFSTWRVSTRKRNMILVVETDNIVLSIFFILRFHQEFKKMIPLREGSEKLLQCFCHYCRSTGVPAQGLPWWRIREFHRADILCTRIIFCG